MREHIDARLHTAVQITLGVGFGRFCLVLNTGRDRPQYGSGVGRPQSHVISNGMVSGKNINGHAALNIPFLQS